MENELIPPKHGGGGGDPNIPFLHIRFLTLKFLRIASPILFTIMLMTIIIPITLLGIPKDAEVFGIELTIPVFYLLVVIMAICYIYNYVYLLKKPYRIIRYAHYSYCKCDKTKWWNKS